MSAPPNGDSQVAIDTRKTFRARLDAAGIRQSIFRVGLCIDNGPMEAFWGTMKSEMYYLHRFEDYACLKAAIDQYIAYYNTRRYQRRLNCMTPIEYRNYLLGSTA
jgi:transposase InsO family protein